MYLFIKRKTPSKTSCIVLLPTCESSVSSECEIPDQQKAIQPRLSSSVVTISTFSDRKLHSTDCVFFYFSNSDTHRRRRENLVFLCGAYLKVYGLAYLKESLSNASYTGFRVELKRRESRISQESLTANFLNRG